jgi:hypothetical protein
VVRAAGSRSGRVGSSLLRRGTIPHPADESTHELRGELFSNPNLDNIGPARYIQNLDELNQVHMGIVERFP